MKFYKHKNQLLIVFLAVGFLIGILYENMVLKGQGQILEIFQTYFLKQYTQTEIVSEEYLWYVAKARLIPFLGICIFGCMKWKKVLVAGSLVWTGFLTGILMVSATIQLGTKGILFCIVSMFPHMICYGVAYSVLLLFLYQYPKRRWNGAKTLFVFLSMFVGIMLETYLNPLLIKMIVKIM